MFSKLAAVVAVALIASPVLAQETVYRPGAGVTVPKPIRQVQPKYTDGARKAGIAGEVDIEGVVMTDGTLSQLRITKSLDTTYGLDDAAMAAAKEWRFEPGTKDGQPVNMWVTLALEFRVSSSAPQTPGQVMVAGGEVKPMTVSEFALGTTAQGTPGFVPPKSVTVVEPKYTAEAMRQKIQGDVEVDVVVGLDGKVSRAMVTRALYPDLDTNALKAALDYKFEPATLNGQPVAALMHVSLTFRLH